VVDRPSAVIGVVKIRIPAQRTIARVSSPSFPLSRRRSRNQLFFLLIKIELFQHAQRAMCIAQRR
jgi:hypothetical protein